MLRVLIPTRWRPHLREALELVLLPGLAAVMPWGGCFRVFWWLSKRCHWLYRDPCERALHEVQARGWVTPAQAPLWLAQRRLVTLIDHADLYLAATRSNRWMQRHLQVQGKWPAAGQAGILATFHWGAGMWGLRHAQQPAGRKHIEHQAADAQAYHCCALDSASGLLRSALAKKNQRTSPARPCCSCTRR